MLKLKVTISALILLTISFLISGCKINTDPQVDIDTNNLILACTAVLPSGITAVAPDTPVDIVISATGGMSPYNVIGELGSFEDSTTIRRTYENDSNDTITVTDTIVVLDTIGFADQCEFDIDVLPSGSVNPSVTVAAAPAASVMSGNVISLTASTEGLGDDPRFTFTFNESGITMDQHENVAIFYVTDSVDHHFTVTVIATNDDTAETAISTIDLDFLIDVPALNCSILHQAGPYDTGDEVEFTIVADNGEELEVTYFDAGDDGSVTQMDDNVITAIYSATGTKTVQALARSEATGTYCNEGNFLQTTVEIAESNNCSAYTQYTNYYRSEAILAWAEVTGLDSGAHVTNVYVDPVAQGTYYLFEWYPLWSEVHIQDTGSFIIQLVVSDNAGNTATCSTDTITVWSY